MGSMEEMASGVEVLFVIFRPLFDGKSFSATGVSFGVFMKPKSAKCVFKSLP